MRFRLHFLPFGFIAISLLAGCSGSSSSSSSSSDKYDSNSSPLIGYWKGLETENPNQVSKITANQTQLFINDGVNNCVSYFEIPSSITSTTYTLSSSGEDLTFSYTANNDNSVTITSTEGKSQTLTKPSDAEVAKQIENTCADSDISGNLSITLEFKKLQKMLAVPSAKEFSHTVNIVFDLDGSLSLSDGDLFIIHQLYVEDIVETKTYDLTKVQPLAFTRFTDNTEEMYSFSVNGYSRIEENKLTLTFDRSKHTLLSNISNATPVAISTYIDQYIDDQYIEDYDTYPDKIDSDEPVFTNGIDTSFMQDAYEDTSNPYSSVLSVYDVSLDIKTIEISITE